MNNSNLSNEELLFISGMDFDQDLTSIDASGLSVGLLADEKTNILLERLDLACDLRLTAQFQSHQLIFPVALEQSEFGQFSMQIQTPEIFELGSQPRNWRHRLAVPLSVTCTIANTQFDLHEISSTGFCLNIDENTDMPELLELELILPDCGSEMQFKASKVRDLNNQTAYEMDLCQERRERLRKFLFNRHRLEHSQETIIPMEESLKE